jgi:hypothetical protein
MTRHGGRLPSRGQFMRQTESHGCRARGPSCGLDGTVAPHRWLRPPNRQRATTLPGRPEGGPCKIVNASCIFGRTLVTSGQRRPRSSARAEAEAERSKPISRLKTLLADPGYSSNWCNAVRNDQCQSELSQSVNPTAIFRSGQAHRRRRRRSRRRQVQRIDVSPPTRGEYVFFSRQGRKPGCITRGLPIGRSGLVE